MVNVDNRGISCLGLCHPLYDVNKLRRIFRQPHVTEARFRWLDKFFNSAAATEISKPATLMRMPMKKFANVHIINGPGLNNNRVQKHEITYGYNNRTLEEAILKKENKFLDKFRKRIEVVAKTIELAPSNTLDFALSPWLEHAPIRDETFNILVEEVFKIIPNVAIIDNPVSGSFVRGNYLKEKHGPNPPLNCDIVDLDGIDMETVDMRTFGERYRRCRAVFAWGLSQNGNHHKMASWLPPSQRTNFPEEREWLLMDYFIKPDALIENSSLNPRDVSGLTMLPVNDGNKRGFLWKMGDDKKIAICLLPANIFPNPPRRIVVVKNGRRVDTGTFRGRYTHDGSNRCIIDFTKPVTSFPTNSVIRIDGKFGFLIKIPGLNRVD